MHSIQPICYGVVSTFFILSTTSCLLRVYARRFMVKNFGLDDWCMVAVLLFHCVQQCLLYFFLHYGGGLHFIDVFTHHPQWIEKLVYGLFVEEIYYVWMHFVIKMAFLLFYLRFATKTFRTLVYVTIGINVVFTITQWLIYCLQCIPLDTFFHPALHPNVKCLHNSVLAFVPAALTIFTDILIVVLPIPSLWAIQVSLSKRLLLIGLVSLGSVVVLISLLRLIVLLEFQKMTDLTWSLGKIIIISSIELDIAIMAANAPSLKILYLKWFGKSRTSRSAGHGLSSISKSRKLATTPLSVCRIEGGGAGDLEKGDEAEKSYRSGGSEEDILKYDSDTGIFVTNSVAVERMDVSRSSEGDGGDYHHGTSRV